METAGVERDLLKSVKRRKMAYFWHVMRKDGECLEKEIIQGTTPESRGRGRPKTTWLSDTMSWTGLGMGELKCQLIHSATNRGRLKKKEEIGRTQATISTSAHKFHSTTFYV